MTASFVLAIVVAGAGCGPKYPGCNDDKQCNSDEHNGFCVSHTCVACRADGNCHAGHACNDGVCVPINSYCDESTTCMNGGACGKDHRCHEVVSSRPAVECDDDHPCKGEGESCQNGHCVAPPHGGPGCTDFPPPLFDFDSPELKPETRDTLQRLSACMTTGSLKSQRVLLTGHCDARGEYEFNMVLGAQRAEVVRTFLAGLGVPADRIGTSSRGKLDANGTDEVGYEHDRRVNIEVR
jgi:hypothetical protein